MLEMRTEGERGFPVATHERFMEITLLHSKIGFGRWCSLWMDEPPPTVYIEMDRGGVVPKDWDDVLSESFS